MIFLALFFLAIAVFSTYYGVFKFEYELRNVWEGIKGWKIPLSLGKLLSVASGAIGILLLTAVIFYSNYQVFVEGTDSGWKELFLNYLPTVAGAGYLFYLHFIRFSNLKNKPKAK